MYFKFVIPNNADGSRVTYSPNWHGTMPKCPKDVTVLLYNDKEGYGIATTIDKTLPKEVSDIEEAEALGTLTIAAFKKDKTGIYFGDTLYDKWIEEVLDGR